MITGYFGLPGCGKSTLATMFAKHYQSKGYRVFCLKEFPIDGCYLFNWSDIGVYDMSNSVIIIDEISLYADNRDFAKFLKDVKRYFILHRHYHCDIIWFTQQYDGVDRKIRELTTCLYYVRSVGALSYAVRINRYIDVDRDRHEIIVGYKISGLLSILLAWWNGCFKLCYRPLYYKYFNSFEAPKLPQRLWPKYPPDPVFDPGDELYLEIDETYFEPDLIVDQIDDPDHSDVFEWIDTAEDEQKVFEDELYLTVKGTVE